MIDAKYYNNGKIKIGSEHYLNPLRKKYIEEDHDMLEIQKYLIHDQKDFIYFKIRSS